MGAYSLKQLTDLTIPNGASNSNVLVAKIDYEDAVAIVIVAPPSLGGDSGLVYLIESGDDEDVNPQGSGTTAAANFNTLQSGDPISDLAAPLQAKTRVYFEIPAVPCFRIHASSTVGAIRTWKVFAQKGTL